MASSSSSAAPSTTASRGAVSHDLIPCLLVGLYAIGVHAVATSLGRAGQIAWGLYLPYAGPALCALALAGLAIVAICALHHHPGRPLRLSLPQELSRWGLTATGAASGIGLLLLLPFFLSLFSSFKSLIPLIVPFSWDGSLAVMDRQLHGGIDPWRWLLPLLDHGLVVAGIDFVYHSLWSFGLFALWSWQVIDRRRPVLRLRFLLALPVIWIGLGSIAATLLSSAGPCYFFAVIDAPDPFAELRMRLDTIDAQWSLTSQMAQDALWSSFLRHGVGFGSGISAMPSVHVGTALLAVLLARHYSRLAMAGAGAFLICIAIGSVVLGWHYAVDAYAAMLLTIPIWWVCGVAAARLCGEPVVQHPTKQTAC